MKKTLLTFLLVSVCVAMQLGAQTNLIANWSGNAITGVGSEANYWGWSSSHSAGLWKIANASSGVFVRFRDFPPATGATLSTGGNFTGREFLYRWDRDFAGSTAALGIGDGTSTNSTGIPLTAGVSYTFSGQAQWINEGTAPKFEFKYSTDKADGSTKDIGSISFAEKVKFYPFSFTFTPSATGLYFIRTTQTEGLVAPVSPSTVSTGGLIGLAELKLIVTPATGISNANSKINVNIFTLGKNIVINLNENISDATLTVYNSLGTQLHEQVIVEGNTTLNKNFASGVYLVRVKNVARNTLSKIIIK